MKTKIVIVEDNFCKFFATKQLLATQLKVEVQSLEVRSGSELLEVATGLNPDMMIFRPEGGVVGLLERFQKRQVNRRNTEIVILLSQDLDEFDLLRFRDAFDRTYARAA